MSGGFGGGGFCRGGYCTHGEKNAMDNGLTVLSDLVGTKGRAGKLAWGIIGGNRAFINYRKIISVVESHLLNNQYYVELIN